MRIYADNASTTKTSKKAIEAMLPYMNTIYANPSSLHSEGQKAAEALMTARKQIAKNLGCTPDEIIFTSGGSEADNQAIRSGAAAGEKKGKKHIISTAFEHHAVLHTLKKLEKEGFDVTLIDIPENGVIDASQVEKAMRDDTCLVSVMYANNEIGTVQPIEEIGKICKKHNVLFHTDAVQAVGHLKIDVKKENADMLSLSAHKFGGPKGVGALYVRRGVKAETLIEGGAQERGRRAGTENVPAIVGMAAALNESVSKIDENNFRILKMRNRLIEGLSAIPHSVLNGDFEKRLCGNVNFCFEGIEGESLLLMLDDKGICASSGSACTSGSLDPSHVLLAIGRTHEIAHGSLRLTLSCDNTDEEIEKIIEAAHESVEYLRSISPIWRDLISGKKEFITK